MDPRVFRKLILTLVLVITS